MQDPPGSSSAYTLAMPRPTVHQKRLRNVLDKRCCLIAPRIKRDHRRELVLPQGYEPEQVAELHQLGVQRNRHNAVRGSSRVHPEMMASGAHRAEVIVPSLCGAFRGSFRQVENEKNFVSAPFRPSLPAKDKNE